MAGLMRPRFPNHADLGGNDFGVADSGPWDDGFSGGAGGGDSWT